MRILIVLGVTTVILGCSDFDRFYAEKRRDSLGLQGGREVVAKVGDEEITKTDLIESLESMPVKQRVVYLSSPERLKEYTESYINQTLLYKEARKRGIEEREDVKQNLEKYKKRLLIQAIAQEIIGQKLGEEGLKKYYEENVKNFEQIRISRLFIKIDPESGVTKDEARARAVLVATRAKAGENFEELVEEFSDDPTSRKNGGDSGYVQKGALPDDIEAEVFKLKEGEISDPIETPNGFYVIKVTEGAKTQPLSRAKGRVQVELRREVLSEYTKDLREEAGVEIFEDRLKEISKHD